MKKFNIEEFVSGLHKEFEGVFSIEEVNQILELDENDYTKDSPLSTGKSLLLNHISFKGSKESGAKINYSQPLFTGINIWIADNNKGKSSILKIIKYALTGKNSLKKSDIDRWITEILLSFEIGNQSYTIYLNKAGRLNAKMFNLKITSFSELESNDRDPLFHCFSETEYLKVIQDFFFNQFSYYSLKWTQKSSVKGSSDLIESDASWKTYFQSIYLESKDSYELMFGEQGKKIFQMILGLELTFPINKLTIKKDFLEDSKGKERLIAEANSKNKVKEKEQLQKQLFEIDNQLRTLNQIKEDKNKVNLTELSKEYELIKKEYEMEWSKHINLDKKIKELKQRRGELEGKRNLKSEEISKAKHEFDKKKRRILELQEYLQIGIFFSNLEIKHCPSCSHTIPENKKKEKLAEHKCTLCDENIKGEELSLDAEDYKEKIATLSEDSEYLVKLMKECEQERQVLQSEFQNSYSEIILMEQDKDKLIDIETLSSKLSLYEQKIRAALQQKPVDLSEREKLIAKKAVIEFQIEEINKLSGPINTQDVEQKIKLLSLAINKLISMRYTIGKSILGRLKTIMLAEIQSFGLTSITDINISEKFDIQYKQNGVFIHFSDITEGEQLRAKIAFYLSLIQLDIEYSMGRHTRFLMIDSPGKEEGDNKYLEGLSSVLKSIEERFRDELQILIGTAERRFENVVKNQFVMQDDKYIF